MTQQEPGRAKPRPATTLEDRRPGDDLRQRQEKLLDEALEETYPASDPIAPKIIV